MIHDWDWNPMSYWAVSAGGDGWRGLGLGVQQWIGGIFQWEFWPPTNWGFHKWVYPKIVGLFQFISWKILKQKDEHRGFPRFSDTQKWWKQKTRGCAIGHWPKTLGWSDRSTIREREEISTRAGQTKETVFQLGKWGGNPSLAGWLHGKMRLL